MKKTLLTLLMIAAFPVMAQVAVTAPTATTTAAPAIVNPNASSSLADSTTNRVFIDQTGDGVNINVTQDGSGNTFGADSTYTKSITGIPNRLAAGGTRSFTLSEPVTLVGKGQTVNVIQLGNNNTIGLKATNSTANSGEGVTVTINQTGNSNFVDAACGAGNASDGSTSLAAGCKSAVLNWAFTGNSNALQFRGAGDSLNSNITVTGSSNEFYIDAVGNKHSQTLQVSGDYNVFNITQTGGGTNGSSVWADITGSTNRFTISQTGALDGVVNIRATTNNSTYNITQRP